MAYKIIKTNNNTLSFLFYFQIWSRNDWGRCHQMRNFISTIQDMRSTGKLYLPTAILKLYIETLFIVPHLIINGVPCYFLLWCCSSVAHLDDFSAYKASIGFEAISQYANNLFVKPWRKEYKVIKVLCQCPESLPGNVATLFHI